MIRSLLLDDLLLLVKSYGSSEEKENVMVLLNVSQSSSRHISLFVEIK